jgi:2-methylisocitrate lyase-like PEP mutase family enzyme
MPETTIAERAQRFADLHEAGIFVIPNPWDIGSARMLVALGAPALATTSAGLAFTLGRPDTGRVERRVALDHATGLARATTVPVSADLENGFGDEPESVAETVRLAIGAGLAGCSIEDSTLAASVSSHQRAKAIARIEAAVEVVRGAGRPFVLTARPDGVMLGSYDLAEGIARLQAFEAAGADVAYAPGLAGMGEVATVCRSVGIPVNALCAGRFVEEPLEAFAEAGVRRVSLGSTLARATHAVIRDAAGAMFGGGSFSPLGGAMPGGEVDELLDRGAVVEQS